MGMVIVICGLRFSVLAVSQDWTNGINWFFACWYNFKQIKRWLKILGVGMVEKGCGHSHGQTLNIYLSEGWADWKNQIFCMLMQIYKK